jgi:uncharacterized protein with FMN-binding domain
VNSHPPASGRPAAKAHVHPDKRSKRNLMLMGSAAVVAVYTAGFFHTAAAAAKMTADEQNRPGSPGRGGDRNSDRAETSPASVRASAPTATAANLPIPAPAPPPPVAATSSLQTPAPAPSPAPAVLPPATPTSPAPVVATAVATPAPTAAPAPVTPMVAATPAAPAPASNSNPVPTAPVQVAALPVAPAPTAPASATATVATDAAAPATPKKYKDGAYFGWGYCRHGELKVTVVMKDDVIVSADITECYTRYSKNVISRLPKQLVDRQNVNKLDRISGASDSSDAYYYAVVEALKAAKP